MKKQTNDIWFNIYVFLLLPFCVLTNIIDIFKLIIHFNEFDSTILSVVRIIIAVISIVFFAYTVFLAKDRVKKSYYLIIATIFYSIVVASYNQVLSSYYDQGFKTILMYFVYLLLLICCWGIPNYTYFAKRKDFFELKKVMSKEELLDKIKEAKENSKNKPKKSIKNAKKVSTKK